MIRRPPRSTLFPYTTLFRSPVVVKPATLSASRGTFLLTDPADLPAWGRELAGYDYDGPLLVEEYLRGPERSEEHTSELQSRQYLVCRLLLEKKKTILLANMK